MFVALKTERALTEPFYTHTMICRVLPFDSSFLVDKCIIYNSATVMLTCYFCRLYFVWINTRQRKKEWNEWRRLCLRCELIDNKIVID